MGVLLALGGIVEPVVLAGGDGAPFRGSRRPMIGRRRSLPHDRPFGQPFEGFTQALRRLSRSMFSSWRSGLVAYAE
jgi:hypothetical protein